MTSHDLAAILPDPVAERLRILANRPVPADGRHVVYWMHHAVRGHENPVHGEERALREKHASYYRSRTRLDKPATISRTQTAVRRGCPFDCGLCPAHEQHTCMGLIEVTTDCELRCPACYASRSPWGPIPSRRPRSSRSSRRSRRSSFTTAW